MSGTITVSGDQITMVTTSYSYNDGEIIYTGDDLDDLATEHEFSLTTIYTYSIENDTLTLTATNDDGAEYYSEYEKQ